MNLSKIFDTVEKYRGKILEAEKFLWEHPETGYREWKSSAYLESEFEKLGYDLVKAGNIPGFYTDLDTGIKGPKILVLGELDSLICNEHPNADKETGAVHACGHNAQGAALLGIAAALKEEGALSGLCGSIRLCAVPAEELIETEFREELRKQGIIKYFGGKPEFLHRGYFDGVDIAFMVHTTNGENSFVSNIGNNGCIVKNIAYKGVASHAGGAPELGVNALYAANLGLSAINAIRETFVDYEHVRVHPIITKGGTAVNAIPSDVTLSTFVRGASMESILDTNKKVNRALAGCAAAMGAKVTIMDRPGYCPLINDTNLLAVAYEAMKEIAPEEEICISENWSTGSTDMGDLSAIMPAIHPYAGGAAGNAHGSDYFIRDKEKACINSAKMQLVLLSMLLSNGAETAKEILKNKNVRFSSKEEYLKNLDIFLTDKEAVEYQDDKIIIS